MHHALTMFSLSADRFVCMYSGRRSSKESVGQEIPEYIREA
jgi:hypothetical protein